MSTPQTPPRSATPGRAERPPVEQPLVQAVAPISIDVPDDVDPARVRVVARRTAGYLTTRLGLGDDAWTKAATWFDAQNPSLGTIQEKP